MKSIATKGQSSTSKSLPYMIQLTESGERISLRLPARNELVNMWHLHGPFTLPPAESRPLKKGRANFSRNPFLFQVFFIVGPGKNAHAHGFALRFQCWTTPQGHRCRYANYSPVAGRQMHPTDPAVGRGMSAPVG